MRRRFATLDVFTDRRFAGNPLAVVLEAEGLGADAMQAIAREFSHPETVFVFAPADPAHRARLRIFTPSRELPFAGHPTVGTAVLLRFAMTPPPGAISCWRKRSARCIARSNR
jgi:trans-2,3-dihydro-3-hydroxyanthranilate isomerase